MPNNELLVYMAINRSEFSECLSEKGREIMQCYHRCLWESLVRLASEKQRVTKVAP